MSSRALAHRSVIILILIVQIIPLLMFPPESFSPQSQEWWLPALLALMVIIADIDLILRRSVQPWPWYLISFAHGFNIISRLMMVWSHATITRGGTEIVNTPYLALTLLAMGLSALLLWYTELGEVRANLLRQ